MKGTVKMSADDKMDMGEDGRSYLERSGSSPPCESLDSADLELLIAVFKTFKEWRDEKQVKEAEADTLEPKDSGNKSDNKSK